MIKKKRFGISQELSRGFSETINVVENNEGTYRNSIIPLSRLELDPENPRKLSLRITDIKNGIHAADLERKQKEADLEKLKELSQTIETSGLINPIVVYKKGESYRIVAGERRFLASMLANKSEIEAKVFNQKPSTIDLKLIQWIENNAREDLSLSEKIGNIRDINEEFLKAHGKNLSIQDLCKIAGISSSQAGNYLTILDAPDDVLDLLQRGLITNLDKAALLSNTQSSDIREQLIQECLSGANLKALRNQAAILKNKKSKSGRKAAKISLGSTQHLNVVNHLVNCFLNDSQLSSLKPEVTRLSWHDTKSATASFKKFIALLEKNLEGTK